MAKKSLKKKTKRDRNLRDNLSKGKSNKNKIIVLFTVALFFFAYMIYAGGAIGSFFSLIIGLVCGLLGVLYLREGKKRR